MTATISSLAEHRLKVRCEHAWYVSQLLQPLAERCAVCGVLRHPRWHPLPRGRDNGLLAVDRSFHVPGFYDDKPVLEITFNKQGELPV